jgi:hypothetical protein
MIGIFSLKKTPENIDPDRESKLLSEFDESEKNFNRIFQLIRQERIETEEAYQKLLKAPAQSVLKFQIKKLQQDQKVNAK